MNKALVATLFTVLILPVFAGSRDQIVIPDRATAVERTAANELQAALLRIAADTYSVVAEKDAVAGRAAYAVGATKLAGKLAATAGWGACEYDEIRRGTADGCVVLDGHAQRGALYSVDSFLEDVAGVRWWTTQESDYPHKPGWTPGELAAYRYAPPFRFRETFYRSTLTDPDFKVRAKVNTTSYTRYIIPPTEEKFIPDEKGGNHKLVFFKGRRSAYHSFFEVLPPAKYAKAHPDWYSEIDGKRIGGGQLCVTNPEMLKEYVKNTLALLRANPDCGAIQVSQNDEGEKTVCRCTKCRAAMEAEGAWSGPYIQFANAVAEAIEREFPNVTVDTFAYQFTRKAPKTVRPRRNVLVRLCDIECAFNRPLADPTYPVNRTFVQDLRDWSKVAAGNLYLWDYQANFTSYMMPHPNLQVFSDNIRLFRDAGAVGLFEQGDAMCPAGDFCALKCYVTAHLMWDPSKDWRQLTDEFLKGYYGEAAAPHLKRVLEISAASATRKDAPAMGCYHAEPFPWITPEAGRAALAEMDAALAASTSNVFGRRLQLLKLSWDHARIRAWKEWGLSGDRAQAIADWKRAIGAFGIDAYRETTTRKTLEDYLSKLVDAMPVSSRMISLDGTWTLAKDGVTKSVTVPHDWAIAGPFDPDGNDDTGKLPYRGTGEYRRSFVLADADWELLKRGGEAYLTLNGAMANPAVRVNGQAAGGWDYGYMSFTLKVGKLLKPGTNDVSVFCDSRPHASRWYPGGGLYRSVRLDVRAPGHARPGSVFITTPRVAAESADVRVVCELDGGDVRTNAFAVAHPRLWSPDDPHLYTVDVCGETFRYGIRTMSFTADDGFHLNGRRLQLKGVCLHSDLGPLGMAFSKGAARRQLALMKDMGANAIRTSHNAVDPQFLDLCDEMGFVVWNECFDKWDGTAGLADGVPPEPTVEKNLRAFVRRDRNHPCVAVWSIGNEIPGASTNYPNGVTRERCRRFRDVVRALDPTRPVGIGAWEAPTAPCFADLDVTGWNYARRYLPMRRLCPDKPIVYTESCSSFSSAGFHSLPLPRSRKDYAIRERACDGYDLTSADYSDIPDVEFHRVASDAYLAGEFVWTGIDYLGEPSPYQHCWSENGQWGLKPSELSRSSYYGIVGLDGIPKDRYYLYRSYWNEKAETAHLVPGRWDFPAGTHVPVFLYARADEAELFLNGRSLGRRQKARDVPGYSLDHDARDNDFAASWKAHPYYRILPKYRLIWDDVPFEPGVLKAVAYRGGREVSRTIVRTVGKPVAVALADDPYSQPDDDIRFVRVSLVDAAGTRVPSATERVSFALEGPGEIVAVGNADANGTNSFACVSSHPLFAGWAVVALRRTGKGPLRLTASADGLKSAVHTEDGARRVIAEPAARKIRAAK